MNYDFKTRVNRRGTGSVKIEQMLGWNPDVAEDIIPLSVADMEFVTPPEIVEGLKKHLDEQILGYSKPYKAYYDAVKSWQKRRHDFDIEDEWIVNSPGVVAAVLAAIRAFTAEGEGVMLFKPIYYPFTSMINLGKRREVNISLLDIDGKYEVDFEGFEREAKKPENKLLILCSPHNPSARVWTLDELTRISKICSENDVVVLSDEIWNDIIMPGYKHTVFANVSSEAKMNSIICTAPSKTFNIAGLKASNIIIPNPDLREKFAFEMNNMHSSSLNALGYKACEVAYNQSEAWLEEMIKVVIENQKVVRGFFENRFPQIKVYEPEGTFLMWLDFRALGIDHLELERRLHEDAQFFTDEGYIFGDEGIGFERLNIACPTDVLEEQLEKLGAWLEKL